MGQLPEDGKPSTIKLLENGLEIECVYGLAQNLHLYNVLTLEKGQETAIKVLLPMSG